MSRKRVAWGLLDQVASSAANLVVVVLAARYLTPTGFGAFSVAFALCLMAVMVLRGVGSEPLASAYAGSPPSALKRVVGVAGSATVASSLLVALPVLVVVWLTWGHLPASVASALVAACLVIPGLALQDYLRYALIVAGRARGAFVNDLTWCVIQIPLMIAAATWWGSPAALVAAWGIAGFLCAALGLAQVRTVLRGPRAVLRWFGEQRKLWPWFTLDNITYQASNFGLVLVISFLASLADVGALRAAMTAFAPLTVVSRGLVGVLVPELARGRADARVVRRRSVAAGGVLFVLACVWWAGLRLMPDEAGRALFGETWTLARPLLVWLLVSVGAGLFISGLVVALRALGAAREGMSARLAGTVLVLVSTGIGARLDGAHGVVIALACLGPVQVAIWWHQLSRTVVRLGNDGQNGGTHRGPARRQSLD